MSLDWSGALRSRSLVSNLSLGTDPVLWKIPTRHDYVRMCTRCLKARELVPSGGRRIGGFRVAVFSLSLSLFLGCSEDRSSGGDRVDVTVTDSAGVQIVRVSGEMLDSLPEWSHSREPVITIGERIGDLPYLFGKVEDALKLQSGEIVIAEGIGFEIRIFGPDGVFRRRFGREGEGPGDFQAMSLWRLQEGGFAVADDWLSRITLFESGALGTIRTGACHRGGDLSLAAIGIPQCYFAGLTGDGTIFWSGTKYAEALRPTIRPDVVLRYPGGVGFLARDLEDSATVVDSIQRANRVRIAEGGDGPLLHWSFWELFSPDGHWAFGQHSVAVGESSRFEIRFRDTTGQVQRILRVARAPDRVTKAHIDAIRDVVGTPASGMPEEIGSKYLDEVDVGGLIPFFGELRFDVRGHLWVAEYVPDQLLVIPDERRWTVFDDSAVPVARMTTGPADDILEIGDDYLLVRQRDDLDVERVALFRIERE